MIGQSVAHYEITALIGEGGMGQVFRATDTKLKRDVALKILPESCPRGSGGRSDTHRVSSQLRRKLYSRMVHLSGKLTPTKGRACGAFWQVLGASLFSWTKGAPLICAFCRPSSVW